LNFDGTYQLPVYFNNGHAIGEFSHPIEKSAEAV